MENLKTEFDTLYKKHFGDRELLFKVFYKFPVGIRFEIGVGDINGKKYMNKCLSRILPIFFEMFHKEDTIFVIVNSYEDDPRDLAGNTAKDVRKIIKRRQVSCKFAFKSSDPEWEDFCCVRHIFKTSVENLNAIKLFAEIIRSAIYRHTHIGGCVYLFNPRNGVIMWPYSDEGLDVIASEKATLEHLYSKFNAWILDYDREQINKTFKAGNKDA